MGRPTKVIVGPARNVTGWAVSEEGRSRPPEVHALKSAAVRAGKELVLALGGGELEIRRRDGTIEEARTIDHPENRRSPG
jgi:hypothetical protein